VFRRNGTEGLYQTDVVQDTDRWWVILKAVMMLGISLIADEILTVQKGFCLMELDN
jgi:hypothetical protein